MAEVLGIACSPRVKGSDSLYDSLSGIMLQGVLEKIEEVSNLTCETVQLAKLNIRPCRGCFSDIETRCHYLCDCYDDDFKPVAEKILAADAVVFATPTYMFGTPGVLKNFLERWISFKSPPVDRKSATKSFDECYDIFDKLYSGEITATNPLAGKVGAMVIAGSELGQDHVARELMLILNLYGFVLPPQCFVYHTGHSMQSLEDVRDCFYQNTWLANAAEKLAKSLALTVKLVKGVEWPGMAKLVRGSR